MRVVSPKQFPGSVDELRRRMLEEFPEPDFPSRPSSQARSNALNVLVDGFMQGSLLTLAVCTPKRNSLFSSETVNRKQPFRTYIVSMQGREPGVSRLGSEKPAAEQPAVGTTPVVR